jgi:outer membrane protein assembly factor BamB
MLPVFSNSQLTAFVLATMFSVSLPLAAADWPGFRGPNGDGINTDSPVPTEWSRSKNLAWTVDLPGKGSSSPIVVGNRVLVTCWSGYGESSDRPGNPRELKRHLVCVDRSSGKSLWSKEIASENPEDAYNGFLTEHGYASSTPVTDGERVYCFFGKSGVFAFTLAGEQLWQVSVGTSSSNRRWGSAASLVLHDDAVIVNASEESRSIRALNKLTGEELWKAEADLLELSYGTPKIVPTASGPEVVLAVPEEVWSLNPENGKLKWYCVTSLTGNISPSVGHHDGMLYVFGGFRGAGSMAIRAGGKGDVTDSAVAWKSSDSSYVATPVLHDGHLFWVDDRGIAWCADAKTGKNIYRERLVTAGGGRPLYSSPILSDDRLYCVSRWDGVYVLAAKPTFEVVAHNKLDGDESDFNASPAMSDGQMFLRSDRSLYCIAK